jgi:acetate kinase
MKVFTVNCGSSSIKFQLFDMTDESVIAKGIMERVGTPEATLAMTVLGRDVPAAPAGAGGADHKVGLGTIVREMVSAGAIASVDEIEGVGHRVVHGGEAMTRSRLIDDEVLAVIKDNCALAPLHNPANLSGIAAAVEALPHAPQVAVFDTAFLADLPPKAYRYAVPQEWYRKYHVRKYGFHGTSHRYVTLRAAELLGRQRDEVNLITCHLGNGCSMTAVAGGKARDHSMGLTPLEGLIMGTRCGDIDPAIVFYLADQGLDYDAILNALNKKSGLLGVSGISNDMRDLLAAADEGNEPARLAVEMFCYRIAKYVGSYFTVLPPLDAVVLTGGIGENSAPVRERICRQLRALGADFDPARNAATTGGQAGAVTSDASRLAVWVVPTNEELMIARDTREAVRPA